MPISVDWMPRFLTDGPITSMKHPITLPTMGDVYERKGCLGSSSPPMSRSQWVSVARTIPKFTASAAAVEPWPVPMSRAVLKANRSDRKRSTMSSTWKIYRHKKWRIFRAPQRCWIWFPTIWGIAPRLCAITIALGLSDLRLTQKEWSCAPCKSGFLQMVPLNSGIPWIHPVKLDEILPL